MSAPTAAAVDPESRPRQVWIATLANRIGRGFGDGHPEVVACREALAYYRVQKAVAAEVNHLSVPGAARLVTQLRQAETP